MLVPVSLHPGVGAPPLNIVWKKTKTNQMRQEKGFSYELPIGRESAAKACILAEIQRQAEERKALSVNERLQKADGLGRLEPGAA